jgi:hypothetical protein
LHGLAGRCRLQRATQSEQEIRHLLNCQNEAVRALPGSGRR